MMNRPPGSDPGSAVSADFVMFSATEIDLVGQSGWSLRSDNDSPEGSAYTNTANATTTGTFTLTQTLNAGQTYYLFVYAGGYDMHNTMDFTIGGATSTSVEIDDRDALTGQWSDAAVITPVSSSAAATVTLHKVGANNQCVFRGLYITTDSTVVVNRDGIAINLDFPSAFDTTTGVAGNYVRNGSFETGWSPDWQLGETQQGPLSAYWDNTVGHVGSCSIKMPLGAAGFVSGLVGNASLSSNVLHLKANRKYTFSCWMKTSTSSTSVSIYAYNVFVPPAGYEAQYYAHSVGGNSHDASWTPASGGNFTADTTWQRFYTTFYAAAYPSADFYMIIGGNGLEGAFLYVTEIQIEEGDVTTYAASNGMDSTIVVTSPGHVFHDTDTVTGTLRAFNSTGGALSRTLRWEIRDYLNRLIDTDSTTVNPSAGTVSSTSFDLSTGGLTGFFRLIYWQDGQENTEKELHYAIIPEPPSGADTTSMLGTHAMPFATALAVQQKLGMKWTRGLSVFQAGRWSIAEPTEGVFVYFDTQAALFATYDMELMLTIGENWPAYADNAGVPNLTKWGTFVNTLVDHYKTVIHYWEVWNEPAFTAAFYAQLLKTACDNIESADATAKIIGCGGVSASYMQSVISELESQYPAWTWQDHIDAFSIHCYPGGQTPESVTAPIIVGESLPVWQTESGYADRIPYVGSSSSFVALGNAVFGFTDAKRFYDSYIEASHQTVAMLARAIAAKHDVYFEYLANNPPFPMYQSSQTFTYGDSSVYVKGIAYAIAGGMLDHATGGGNVAAGGTDTYFLMFDRGASAPIAVVMSSDNKARQVTVSLTTGQFQVRDMMGNVISSTTAIHYGRQPIYVEGVGISYATLSSALSGGTIALRTDDTAPNLSIVAGPRATVASGIPFRMRWVAFDSNAYPNLGEINTEASVPADVPNPTAILYRYQLTPYSSWSAWVPDSFIDYTAVPNGSYTFQVEAKDTEGNTTSTLSRSLTIA